MLFQASQSTSASQREGAFRIFATTPGIIEKQHEDTVLAAFTKGFEDEDVSVRLLIITYSELSLMDTGTISSGGRFRVVLPVYHQKVPGEILSPASEDTQYPSTSQRVWRLGTAHQSPNGTDRFGRSRTENVPTFVPRSCSVQHHCHPGEGSRRSSTAKRAGTHGHIRGLHTDHVPEGSVLHF